MMRSVLALTFWIAAASALTDQHVEIIRLYPGQSYCPNLFNQIVDCGSKAQLLAIRAKGCPGFPCHARPNTIITVEADFIAANYHDEVVVKVEPEKNNYKLPSVKESVKAYIQKGQAYTIQIPLLATLKFGYGPIRVKILLEGTNGGIELCGSNIIIISGKPRKLHLQSSKKPYSPSRGKNEGSSKPTHSPSKDKPYHGSGNDDNEKSGKPTHGSGNDEYEKSDRPHHGSGDKFKNSGNEEEYEDSGRSEEEYENSKGHGSHSPSNEEY